MNQLNYFYQRERYIYIIGIVVSLLLSGWMMARVAIINPDAICYLSGAEMFGQGGIKAVLPLCSQSKWPFYSVLIYAFVQLTHLSFIHAAYVLNSFFTLGSVLVFVLIVKTLGGSKRVLWLALLTILLSHTFNSVREYIIRDHGFWFFYLTSMLFLLRYFQKLKWSDAICFSFSLLIAALFRVEGILFLLFLPFVAFVYRSYSLRERLVSFFVLSSPVFILVLLAAAWLILHPQHSVAEWGRIPELLGQFQHGFAMMAERYVSTQTALAKYVLPSDSMHEAGLILWIILAVWYVFNVFSNLSWGYTLALAYQWLLGKPLKIKNVSPVLMTYLVINVFITFIFLFEHFFLSKRYLIALSLVLMLWIPFALDELIERRAELRYQLYLFCAAIFIFISATGGIFEFGYSKQYVSDAGGWIALHVPQKANLYVNDYQLMYYSKHFGYKIFDQISRDDHVAVLKHGKWKQYDYLALRVKRRDTQDIISILQEISVAPLQIFSNKGGDQVIIYKT